MSISLLWVVLVGYILGAFPTGYIICKLWCKIDIRTIGSGRTGGTNVLRSAGVFPAILTIVGDTAKAYGAVWISQRIMPTPLAGALAGAAAVLGHNHSVFLGGMGGAGSMATIGGLLALSPVVALTSLFSGVIPLALSRFASLGSITLALMAPILLGIGAYLDYLPSEYVIYGLLVCLMTLYELRPNIQRLLAGQERKIGEKAT